MPEPEPRPVVMHVSWSALARLALAILVGWAAVKLWPEFLLLVISVLLAVTLDPLVARLSRGRVSRGATIALLALASVAAAAAAAVFLLPPLVDEMSRLLAHLPAFRQRMAAELGHGTFYARVVDEVLALPGTPEARRWLARPLSWGMTAVEGATGVILVVVLTFYLLLDGKVLYAWLLAYVPRRHRARMASMLPEVEDVVSAYVTAQAITSALFGGFVFAVLTVFGVPAPVPLAVLAAFCDAVPILGIFLATVPAVLLALSISSGTALAVLGLYAAYHAFETYVLVPRLYGNRLSLSPLAVLLALVVGGALQGVIGAVLILPFVAAYPVVEKYWLSSYLSDEVVDDHQALAQAQHGGEKREVADQVLRGEEPEVGGVTGGGS